MHNGRILTRQYPSFSVNSQPEQLLGHFVAALAAGQRQYEIWRQSRAGHNTKAPKDQTVYQVSINLRTHFRCPVRLRRHSVRP